MLQSPLLRRIRFVAIPAGIMAEKKISPLPVSPLLPHLEQGDSRLFLDICSGSSRPLSLAILAQHGTVLSFDIFRDQWMELLNDGSYAQFCTFFHQVSYCMARHLLLVPIIPD